MFDGKMLRNDIHERQAKQGEVTKELKTKDKISTPTVPLTPKSPENAKREAKEVTENRKESKEKEARSFLRDEFLGILFTITNQPVKIQFDKTKDPLSATFTGSDFTFSTVSVKDLKTTLGKEPHSLLRTSDITCINYETQI